RQQADGGMAVSFQFENVPGDPAEWSFHYRVPTLLIDVPLRFSLENIPLAADQRDRVKKPVPAPLPDDSRSPRR
ncbi:MAG: hypothetical protein KDA79_23530, partial [Planctomycetaceae bacterium]|nr:hypothetical protein [Planctomycetaceae bacterium]